MPVVGIGPAREEHLKLDIEGSCKPRGLALNPKP